MIKLYSNGSKTSVPGGGNPNPPPRGVIGGWSRAAVRRHTQFLYSVETSLLSGWGYAYTLTLRDTPKDAATLQAMRRAWEKRVKRFGATRVHWVVEWTRRGVPHIHAAVYFVAELPPDDVPWPLFAWLDVVRGAESSAQLAGQHAAPIYGAEGWLMYLSKHAARGVNHYQRQGKPAGWESSGRLWGKSGDWPVVEPEAVPVSWEEFWRWRRLARSWRIAQARSAGDWERVKYARRMLRCNEPNLSRVRGTSEWMGRDLTAPLLELVLDE